MLIEDQMISDKDGELFRSNGNMSGKLKPRSLLIWLVGMLTRMIRDCTFLPELHSFIKILGIFLSENMLTMK